MKPTRTSLKTFLKADLEYFWLEEVDVEASDATVLLLLIPNLDISLCLGSVCFDSLKIDNSMSYK
jgi:hypothetical protein